MSSGHSETEAPITARWYRARDAASSCRAACPIHSVGHVSLGQAELLQLSPHGVGAGNPYRRQHDASIFFSDIEILGALHGGDHGLGQGELVLGRQFGEHGSTFSKDVRK